MKAIESLLGLIIFLIIIIAVRLFFGLEFAFYVSLIYFKLSID